MDDTPPRDIVIIGGGIIGVCSAYYLLQHPSAAAGGVRVTLVEENAVASAASGKAGGFLALDWHGPATTSLAELSFGLHTELAAQHSGAQRWGYRAMDSVSIAVSARERGKGRPPSPHVALEQAPMSSLYDMPEDNLEAMWLNQEGDISVLGTRDTTAQVHPRQYTEALFELARAKGLNFVHGRPTRLNRAASTSRPESLDIAVTPANAGYDSGVTTIPCTDLVFAAGPWTGLVAQALGISPVPPVTNLPGHSVLIRPPPNEAVPSIAVFGSIYGANRRRSADGRTTESPEIFPRPDGTVYVAGENAAEPLPARPGDVAGLVDSEIAQRLVRAAKLLSGTLADGAVEAKQLCYRPTTTDGRPIVGKMQDHIWIATGHGPWGITLSTGTGKVISELILDGAAKSADISNLDPARFNVG